VRVYVYVSMYIYIYIHMYIYVRVRVYTYVFIYTYIYIYMYIYTYIYDILTRLTLKENRGNFAHLLFVTPCNTLQHTATHCNTLQHTATHCNTLQHTQPAICRFGGPQYSVSFWVSTPQPLIGTNLHVTWANGRWSVLQCVAVVTQCVAVCCRALQCVASSVDGSEPARDMDKWLVQCVAACCSVLQSAAVLSQCVAECCSVLTQPLMGANLHATRTLERWSVLHCVAVCRSVLQVLQYVTVCCSVSQCVAVRCNALPHPLMCVNMHVTWTNGGGVCCSVLHRWHGVLQCVAERCSVLPHPLMGSNLHVT